MCINDFNAVDKICHIIKASMHFVFDVLRVYPLTFTTSRYLEEDLEIGGYNLPAGVCSTCSLSCVFVLSLVLHIYMFNSKQNVSYIYIMH